MGFYVSKLAQTSAGGQRPDSSPTACRRGARGARGSRGARPGLDSAGLSVVRWRFRSSSPSARQPACLHCTALRSPLFPRLPAGPERAHCHCVPLPARLVRAGLRLRSGWPGQAGQLIETPQQRGQRRPTQHAPPASPRPEDVVCGRQGAAQRVSGAWFGLAGRGRCALRTAFGNRSHRSSSNALPGATTRAAVPRPATGGRPGRRGRAVGGAQFLMVMGWWSRWAGAGSSVQMRPAQTSRSIRDTGKAGGRGAAAATGFEPGPSAGLGLAP